LFRLHLCSVSYKLLKKKQILLFLTQFCLFWMPIIDNAFYLSVLKFISVLQNYLFHGMIICGQVLTIICHAKSEEEYGNIYGHALSLPSGS